MQWHRGYPPLLVEDSDRIKITQQDATDQDTGLPLVHSSLTIDDVQLMDLVYYECQALNDFGLNTSSGQLVLEEGE